MRVIVVGMGIQGSKRKRYLGKDFTYSVDKFKKANFKSIYEVPLNKFDAAIVCVPDKEKIKILDYCIVNHKHVLIEKPLITNNTKIFSKFEKIAKKKNLICYTAYNHRFEPNIIKMKELIQSKKLGKLYKCRIFYGNGTSLLVKKSQWRDKGLGVITDIGSHLLDICLFLFGNKINSLKIIEINKFENKAPDHSIITLKINNLKIELEMSLCMWKNSFNCDVIGSKGSAHLNSLCKWDKNTFLFRKRKLPSGAPTEKYIYFKKGDPTWKKEYRYFKNLIKRRRKTNFKRDWLINSSFLKLKKSIV